VNPQTFSDDQLFPLHSLWGLFDDSLPDYHYYYSEVAIEAKPERHLVEAQALGFLSECMYQGLAGDPVGEEKVAVKVRLIVEAVRDQAR